MASQKRQTYQQNQVIPCNTNNNFLITLTTLTILTNFSFHTVGKENLICRKAAARRAEALAVSQSHLRNRFYARSMVFYSIRSVIARRSFDLQDYSATVRIKIAYFVKVKFVSASLAPSGCSKTRTPQCIASQLVFPHASFHSSARVQRDSFRRNYHSHAIFDYSVDENNSLMGLFVSTPSMKHTYEIFPEILMIDATYGLFDHDYPLVIAAIVDGNGITEIVSFGIVAQETDDSYSWFIDCIIEHLPGCKQTVAFVSDKDMVLRKVIKLTRSVVRIDAALIIRRSVLRLLSRRKRVLTIHFEKMVSPKQRVNNALIAKMTAETCLDGRLHTKNASSLGEKYSYLYIPKQCFDRKNDCRNTLLEAVRAGNYAHWLTYDDIEAVLALRYGIREFRLAVDDEMLLAILDVFKVDAQLTLLPIVINRHGSHWTCLVLEKCARRLFAYHQDSKSTSLSQMTTRSLELKGYQVFDACKLQQPITDSDNCGIWVLLNIASILGMLEKQMPESRMTAESWAKRARRELSKALRTCNRALLDSYREEYADILEQSPAYDRVKGQVNLNLSTEPPPRAQSKAVASLLAKIRSKNPADVEIVDLEEESPSTPATKELKSIPRRPAPSTIPSTVTPNADLKRLSAVNQQEVVVPKRRKTDHELMYESGDDDPIISLCRSTKNRIESSSSSSDESGSDEEAEKTTTFKIEKCSSKLLQGVIDIDSLLIVAADPICLATAMTLSMVPKRRYKTVQNKKMTSELSKRFDKVKNWVEGAYFNYGNDTIYVLFGMVQEFKGINPLTAYKSITHEAATLMDKSTITYKRSHKKTLKMLAFSMDAILQKISREFSMFTHTRTLTQNDYMNATAGASVYFGHILCV
ncbi:unnamed protein product [Trichogramma brassicae]|uniref:ZSWIM1/3 RNaseH-like domain-containing protein n=1 Tax=Trichogramma brassicae TaxID=86971 RepID=A0A6H5J216_9HYME|nr:unnamed protein product [Trichogramma brassicae]